MLYRERQERILDYIKEKPAVSVAELSDIFGVSTVTIRKDLNKLSENGKIERTHGGAMSLNKSNYEEPEDAKESMNIESKQEIAAKALELIEEGSTIMLDAGSTTLELARLLVERTVKGVTVITHALNIAYMFRQNLEYRLVMVGGQYRPGIMSFVGPYAVNMMRELHADKGFIGINGFTLDEGLSTPNPYEAEMKRNILLRSRECYLLSDARKYGNVCMSRVADVSELDGIITDAGLPENVRESLVERGVKVY